ncbi:MAG: traS protein [Brachymonas sp.]|nr:traS protein [Brachymonas sp.]
MSLHNNIDDWFLGYKTRAVRAKNSGGLALGSGRRTASPLKPGSGLANLRAAALKHPEVMVKIPRRKSGSSNGMKGVRNHLDYISRNGKLTVETQDGEKINGKQGVNDMLKQWQRLRIPEESRHKEALNIVLSMPQGTPPQAVLDAAREFAREQFKGHQYAFALHTDSDNADEPAHPHVHLCVLMRNEFGQRLNPRKNDLFEWRVRFAEKMREQGVPCAATKRQHRGITPKGEPSILRAMRQRGHAGEVHKAQAQALMAALADSERPKHPFLQEAMQTRGIITEEYGLIAKELYKMGHKTEARIISQLAQELKDAGFTTRAQQSYDTAAAHLQRSGAVPEPSADTHQRASAPDIDR